MQKPILKYGSSFLRQNSLEVLRDEQYLDLVENLFDSLNTKEGIGLAAPQIGILKRMFVIAVPLNENKEDKFQYYKKAFINPSIISKSNTEIYYNEGCLSVPGIYEDVLRPESINVTYFDTDFNYFEEELDGIVARVFQHEFDHLNGILFIDHINRLKKRLISNKLNRIKKNR